MGFLNEKSSSKVYAVSTQSPGAPPYSAASRDSGFASLPDLEKKDQVSPNVSYLTVPHNVVTRVLIYSRNTNAQFAF